MPKINNITNMEVHFPTATELAEEARIEFMEKQRHQDQIDAMRYMINDIYGLASLHRKLSLEIKKVIFNDPATIVLWMDGTKTVVKAENEGFDPEKGLAMAIAKKAFGNKGNYFNKIKKWTNQYYEHNEEGDKTK